MCLALMSTNALSHSIVELDSSYLEVSAMNYRLDSDSLDKKDDASSIKLKYGWEGQDNIGYNLSYESL